MVSSDFSALTGILAFLLRLRFLEAFKRALDTVAFWSIQVSVLRVVAATNSSSSLIVGRAAGFIANLSRVSAACSSNLWTVLESRSGSVIFWCTACCVASTRNSSERGAGSFEIVLQICGTHHPACVNHRTGVGRYRYSVYRIPNIATGKRLQGRHQTCVVFYFGHHLKYSCCHGRNYWRLLRRRRGSSSPEKAPCVCHDLCEIFWNMWVGLHGGPVSAGPSEKRKSHFQLRKILLALPRESRIVLENRI